MALLQKRVELGAVLIVMILGIFALVVELFEYEEIAKVVVIPSLLLLTLVTGYALFRSSQASRIIGKY